MKYLGILAYRLKPLGFKPHQRVKSERGIEHSFDLYSDDRRTGIDCITSPLTIDNLMAMKAKVFDIKGKGYLVAKEIISDTAANKFVLEHSKLYDIPIYGTTKEEFDKLEQVLKDLTKVF